MEKVQGIPDKFMKVFNELVDEYAKDSRNSSGVIRCKIPFCWVFGQDCLYYHGHPRSCPFMDRFKETKNEYACEVFLYKMGITTEKNDSEYDDIARRFSFEILSRANDSRASRVLSHCMGSAYDTSSLLRPMRKYWIEHKLPFDVFKFISGVFTKMLKNPPKDSSGIKNLCVRSTHYSYGSPLTTNSFVKQKN